MPSHILSSLLVGLAATLGTIVIHGFVVHTIVMTLRRHLQRVVLGVPIWVSMTFIMGATLLAFAGHLVEIALWAFALDICGAVANISAAIYSSAGSYTTAGSDIILPPRWKLLGPFEAVPAAASTATARCRAKRATTWPRSLAGLPTNGRPPRRRNTPKPLSHKACPARGWPI
jgi:hypothetical protein